MENQKNNDKCQKYKEKEYKRQKTTSLIHRDYTR